MKLFLDTTNEDFVLAIFNDENNLVYKSLLKKYPKKVELIPQEIEKMLVETKLKLNDFKIFYTNIGPGFFTGVRISLVYLRTIAQIKKINIKTISTMKILSLINPDQIIFNINARGEKYYSYTKEDNYFHVSQIKIKTGTLEKYDEINYDLFLENFSKFESFFDEHLNIDEIEPLYIKLPQIGGKNNENFGNRN
ncbi:molecular chaperone [Mycoplasmopsis maculosa]|uniref:Molecular chaperone n=1 Tax=Mycoplasmopsis maculosa TaxID=114885 RepID=A0A449B561_9BACT|nr:tRNA (adenosine(37)-N6)-threonylcarbamoyltransferase complex dimerization subunit type 1 TsaB [Mycoplasmopsis maculosa]VEU75744.1 molecular chaperone [Mycoplasmopsis maculosa]